MAPRFESQAGPGGAAAAAAARSTVAGLFGAQAAVSPRRVALQAGARRLTFAALDERSRRLAAVLDGRGVGRGDRVAVLSENRLEYAEALLAAARLGAIAACQNWRLTAGELARCLDLVEPRLTLVSPRHRGLLAAAREGGEIVVYGPPTRTRWRRRRRSTRGTTRPHPRTRC